MAGKSKQPKQSKRYRHLNLISLTSSDSSRLSQYWGPEIGSNIPDVSLQLFEKYRLRYLEYGNWLSQRDRQERSCFCRNKDTNLKANHNRLLMDNGRIRPFSDFLQKVRKIDKDYNATYLNAEYNFAVASAQAAARWHDFSASSDDYYLQYRTARDERVRSSHRPLDRITLPADDPFWDEFFPPNGWNCRCNVVQVGKNSRRPSNSAKAIARGRAATTQLDSKGRNKAKIFRFNPGKKQKVFPDKHPYFKVNDPDVERTVEAMSKENEIVIPTEKGSVLLSATQNKHEINDNTTIAVYLANKHGYDIELLDINNNKNVKNPDSLNRTLSLKQEYKTQKNATRNSIEQAIRNGAKQADSIVLNIEKTELTKELIKHIVQHRMRRYDNLNRFRHHRRR